MNSRPEHTQKHTDKLIILKKQRPGAHLAYFPRQHWDVGRGIEFRGGCSCTLGNIQYSKCEMHINIAFALSTLDRICPR